MNQHKRLLEMNALAAGGGMPHGASMNPLASQVGCGERVARIE